MQLIAEATGTITRTVACSGYKNQCT